MDLSFHLEFQYINVVYINNEVKVIKKRERKINFNVCFIIICLRVFYVVNNLQVASRTFVECVCI